MDAQKWLFMVLHYIVEFSGFVKYIPVKTLPGISKAFSQTLTVQSMTVCAVACNTQYLKYSKWVHLNIFLGQF
jgi:hypothetical protein